MYSNLLWAKVDKDELKVHHLDGMKIFRYDSKVKATSVLHFSVAHLHINARLIWSRLIIFRLFRIWRVSESDWSTVKGKKVIGDGGRHKNNKITVCAAQRINFLIEIYVTLHCQLRVFWQRWDMCAVWVYQTQIVWMTTNTNLKSSIVCLKYWNSAHLYLQIFYLWHAYVTYIHTHTHTGA